MPRACGSGRTWMRWCSARGFNTGSGVSRGLHSLRAHLRNLVRFKAIRFRSLSLELCLAWSGSVRPGHGELGQCVHTLRRASASSTHRYRVHRSERVPCRGQHVSRPHPCRAPGAGRYEGCSRGSTACLYGGGRHQVTGIWSQGPRGRTLECATRRRSVSLSMPIGAGHYFKSPAGEDGVHEEVVHCCIAVGTTVT